MSSAGLAARPLARTDGAAWIGVAAGLAVWLGGVSLDQRGAWAGLLTASLFGLALSLGALVFMAIQVASGASWWLPVAAVPRLLARTLAVPSLALAACLLGGLGSLYPWARAGAVEASPLIAAKALWLSPPLFLARAVIVIAVWLGFASLVERRLIVLFDEPTLANRRLLVRASIGFLIAYAFTQSVASWDWTMSLEPEWFSTMRGVYGFAGTFVGGIAAICALAVGLDARGKLEPRLGESQRHDLGKLLFAFSTFWGYIWFCEFLLIWYANLPEETGHFAARLDGGWGMLFWLNPVLCFGIPFALLMSASAKRHPTLLLQASLVVLLGRWLDVYLMVQPTVAVEPSLPVSALAATAVVLGGMWLAGRRAFGVEGR